MTFFAGCLCRECLPWDQTFNDPLKAQERYNKLDSKYQAVVKEVHQLRPALLKLQNLQDNAIPKRDRMIAAKEKECEDYSQQILKLRKDLEAKDATEAEVRKEVETLKVQLDAKIGSVIAWQTRIQKLDAELSQTEGKLKEANEELSQSERKLKKANEDLHASSETIKDLEWEKDDQAGQLQEINFFGPFVQIYLPI